MATGMWWDWPEEELSRDQEQRGMGESEIGTAFEDLVGRCIALDNLPSNVTFHRVRTVLGQFGTVLRVKLLIYPQDVMFTGKAIAEMDNNDQREQIVRELKDFFFMLEATPCPVRAIAAIPASLIDHPWRRNPNIIQPRLVSRTEPGAEFLWELEHLARLKVEDDCVLQKYMEEDEIRLAKLQKGQCQSKTEELSMIAREHKAGIFQQLKRLHRYLIIVRSAQNKAY